MADSIRKSVLDYLGLVASQGEQLKYERNVPRADLPSELICQFADDLFHPTLMGLMGFTADEARQLAEFYGRLCVASDALERHEVGSVNDMLRNPEWINVMSNAKELRARLERDG